MRLVISDAHEGLKRAIATVLSGATWQRCRVHFMRNLLATIPRSAREPVAAIVRTIFAQPDRTTAQAQLRKVVEGLRGRFAPAAELLEQAAEDVLAYLHFPVAHRRQLHSTNPLERLNKEIKRRSAVVGIFPHRDSLLRLVGALLAEQDDEWAVADRRYFSAESMQQLTQPLVATSQEELLAAIAWTQQRGGCAYAFSTTCRDATCGGRMVLLPTIEDASVIARILTHLELPLDTGEPDPARPPPEPDAGDWT